MATDGSDAEQGRGWPSVDQQLERAHAPRDSGLERVIRQNQDTEWLHPSEVRDGLPYPPWLRIRWRKAHPDEYPAGEQVAYPLMLERVEEWFKHHPDSVEATDDPVDGAGRST